MFKVTIEETSNVLIGEESTENRTVVRYQQTVDTLDLMRVVQAVNSTKPTSRMGRPPGSKNKAKEATA